MRNRLADHLAEILGLGMGQVNEGRQVGGVSALWLTKNPIAQVCAFLSPIWRTKSAKLRYTPGYNNRRLQRQKPHASNQPRYRMAESRIDNGTQFSCEQ